MNLDSYPVISSEDLLTHTFISEGPKGQILKRIEFQCCDQNQFNLAFGNWKNANQTLDDIARSNNNDRDKILATVAKAIMLFRIQELKPVALLHREQDYIRLK